MEVKNKKEEYVIILDIVNNGFSKNEIVQGIGEENFGLMELVPKKDAQLFLLERVYIGDDKRDKIQYVKKSLTYDDISENSKVEILSAIEQIVKSREEYFIKIINRIGAINIRSHGLELIHGIGKKYFKSLLDIRDEAYFESFEDIKKRCSFFQNPVESISKRILDEISNKDSIKIFTTYQNLKN